MTDSKYKDGREYKVPGQHVYEGMVMSQYTPRDHMEKMKAMKTYDDDVIVSTYPKSGTTMLLEIVKLVLHDADISAASRISTWKCIPFIEYVFKQERDGLAKAEKIPRPRLLKTHLPRRLLPAGYKQANIKQISILRNPKDVLISYYYFYKSAVCLGKFTGSWNEFFEMFMADKLCWGNVFDHALEWWEVRNDPNVLVLFFEDVLRDPLGEIENITKFVGKKLEKGAIEEIAKATSFQTMKSNPMTNASNMRSEIDFAISPFMRKGNVGDWKNHFTDEQNARMDEVMIRKLEGSGLMKRYQYEI